MKWRNLSKKQVIAIRRRGETTIKVRKHDLYCLYSDGLIVPKHECTCNVAGYFWMNVIR